jgi:hypothetical protein
MDTTELLARVHISNAKREEHIYNYLKKAAELQNAIKQQDWNSCASLQRELQKHVNAISCDSEVVCEMVTDSLLPTVKGVSSRMLKEEAKKMGKIYYSEWESRELNNDKSSSPAELEEGTKSETTPALSPKNVVPVEETEESANSETAAVDSETVSDQNEVAGRSAERSKARWFSRLQHHFFAPPSSTGEESAPEGDNSANDTTDGESEINVAAAVEIASESVVVASEISEDESSTQAQTSEGDVTAAPLSQQKSDDVPSSSTLGAVNTASFNAILHSSSEDNLVAGMDLPILLLVQSLIDLLFRQQPSDLYEHLKNVAFGLISVLSDIPNLYKLFALYIAAESNKEAGDMESIARMGSSTGIGSIAAFCEVNDCVEDGSQPPEGVPDWLFEVKAAIYRAKHGHNDDDIKDTIYLSKHEGVEDVTGISRDVIYNEVTNDDVRSFIDRKVSNSCVKGHLSMDFETTNLLRHVLDLYFVTSLLQKMTVADIFRFLSKESDLIEDVKEFARRSNPTVDFDVEVMAALDFLFIFVLPAFERDELLNEAWQIGCLILCHLNKITSVGNKASSDAKAKDPRKIKMRHEQRQVECESFDGVLDEYAAVFWSGEGDTHSTRGERLQFALLPCFSSGSSLRRAFSLLSPLSLASRVPSSAFLHHRFVKTAFSLNPTSFPTVKIAWLRELKR